MARPSSGAFLRGAGLRFQFHKLPGHFIVGPLREDPQDGEPRLVHVDAAPQRAPAGAAAFVRYVSELHHSDAQHPVLPRKAVILHADLELVGVGAVFVSQDAANDMHGIWIKTKCLLPPSVTLCSSDPAGFRGQPLDLSPWTPYCHARFRALKQPEKLHF